MTSRDRDIARLDRSKARLLLIIGALLGLIAFKLAVDVDLLGLAG